MATVTLTNLTANVIPVNSFVGKLAAGATRSVELTAEELEQSRAALAALEAAGMLTFAVSRNASSADDKAEFAPISLLGGGRQWTSGNGTPEAAVVGSPGDLFSRLDGGAGTVLYVKESGVGTNTGWVAK